MRDPTYENLLAEHVERKTQTFLTLLRTSTRLCGLLTVFQFDTLV
jgi:hypothetical protein